MDPNACLDELLRLVAGFHDSEEELNPDDVERVAELLLALDGWLTGGGFLPARWRPAAVPATAELVRELLARPVGSGSALPRKGGRRDGDA